MPDHPSPDPVSAKPAPPIVCMLADFLDANPEYRQYVFWSEEHQDWAMPGWVADALLNRQRARGRKPLDQQTPEERAGREGRN
jgi:hypothetical protein